MPDEDEPLLNTAQAAKRLGVSARTLNDWKRDGIVTPAFVTPGRHARWRESDLRRQIEDWNRRLADE